MSTSLAEALKQVELEPGRTYCCQVNGHWVEVRVLPEVESAASRIPESDIMLDAWVELPPPKPIAKLQARLGKLPLPDVPEIPRDDEAS